MDPDEVWAYVAFRVDEVTPVRALRVGRRSRAGMESGQGGPARLTGASEYRWNLYITHLRARMCSQIPPCSVAIQWSGRVPYA
jgi:hypothetical protein